jgi:hypothetical protein
MQCFLAQTLDQRFHYETMSGSSPGGSHRDNTWHSAARERSRGFVRRRNAHQFRCRFQCTINSHGFVGNRQVVRSRLAPDTDRRRLEALQRGLMGLDVRRLVLAKRRAMGLGNLPLWLMA